MNKIIDMDYSTRPERDLKELNLPESSLSDISGRSSDFLTARQSDRYLELVTPDPVRTHILRLPGIRIL